MAFRPLTNVPISLLGASTNFLNGGTLYAYLAGTSTPTDMYQDSSGTSAGPEVTLDSRGEPTGFKLIWIDEYVTYKFILKDSAGVTIWTVDDISVGAGGSDMVTPHNFGCVGDGVTDDYTNLLACLNSGAGAVDLLGKTWAVSAQLSLSGVSNLLVFNGTIKSIGSVAGNSSVLSGTNLTNVVIDNVEFNANGQRRWGVSFDNTCSSCRLDDVDAKYFTDIFGQGIRASVKTPVTLKQTRRIGLINQYSASGSTASGSIPTGTYKISVAAVDALGREGPLYIFSQLSDIVLASNGQLSVSWDRDEGARSYRVYVGLSSTFTWQRYYTVPVTNTDPASYSKTVSAGYAAMQTTPTVATAAAAYTGQMYTNVYFRVAGYFADGAACHSGNQQFYNPYFYANPSTCGDVSWAAPAGATPSGYVVCVSSNTSGGLRNFEEVIDVGNVTSYRYSGAVGYRMAPWGDFDEVPADGYSPRNFGKSRGVQHGDMLQYSEAGYDNTYKHLSISDTTNEAFGAAQNGRDYLLKKLADTFARLYWRDGQRGNSELWRLAAWYPTQRDVIVAGHDFGVTLPSQTSVSAYLSANNVNNTGDGTFITLICGTEEYDINGNNNSSTGIFTAPVSGYYVCKANVYFKSTAGTAYELRVRQGATDWAEAAGLPTANKEYSVKINRRIYCAAGSTIYFQFAVYGAAKDTTIYAHARSTAIEITLDA